MALIVGGLAIAAYGLLPRNVAQQLAAPRLEPGAGRRARLDRRPFRRERRRRAARADLASCD
jgi:hypothetical protein